MSLGSRTTTRGGAKTGGKEKHALDKTKGTDKPQPKEKIKPQATTEQLRMANMIDRKSEDASDVRRMVLELMEMTCRTEEEVCSALHDSDNDMVAACNLLLEDTQRIQGEWQTREKKKKKPPTSAGNGEVEPPRDPRSRSGPRPRRGEGECGGGAGRGRGRGAARGAGRGGRGGRRGGPPRARPSRPEPDWNDNNDTGGNPSDAFPATEDWDNEEWSGSLSDTKVFTPSTQNQTNDVEQASSQINAAEDWDSPQANGPTEGHIPTYTYHNAHHHHSLMDQMNSAPKHTAPPLPSAAPVPAATIPAACVSPAPQPTMESYHQPMGMSGSLSAAQSQYLSQLTQQSQRHDHSVYTTNYGVYGSSDMTSQRKPQRARVPPPSKIPVSAVEMPGGGEAGGAMFLDVQFGALEPEALQEAPPAASLPAPPAAKPQPEPEPAPVDQPPANYTTPNNMLNESLASAVDTTPVSQPVTSEPVVTNNTCNGARKPNSSSLPSVAPRNLSLPTLIFHTLPAANSNLTWSQEDRKEGRRWCDHGRCKAFETSALEKQLTASMKQLTVSPGSVAAVSGVSATSVAAVEGSASAANATSSAPHHAPQQQQHAYVSHRPKTVGQQNVYAHHPVSHHPQVYGTNVYAQQVNSTNASLTGASAMTATAYPSSVTLTQYQPMINSYQPGVTVCVAQTTGAGAGAGVQGAGAGYSALYTAGSAPYAYQPTQPAKMTKDQAQYDSSVAASNSLTSTSTTQTSTAKVATSSAHAAGSGSGVGGSGGGSGAAGYAAGTLYNAGQPYGYDDQLLRTAATLPHHMGGYYEVGYGVGGVGGAREGTFGLGAGERFGRADAASPQQVPAALPPGYAYFYQPPPTTYQYGVYPYAGGSSVGGVGGVGGVSGAGGKVSTYAQQQQPPYDAQDTYKTGQYNSGPYTATASKSGAASSDLTNAMYAKTHVALNKVNSYEKASFHSGTPPPFGAGSHLFIPAPPHHHHHHAAQHQMDVRVNSSHNRRESGAGGGRSAAAKPPASKPAYSQSYWAPN